MNIKSLILAALALALAACTNDIFVGQTDIVPEGEHAGATESAEIIINGFGENAAAPTRVAGESAANLLGGSFRVYGKNDKGVVFNNYIIKWVGTDETTVTNVNGWEYQGYMSLAAPSALQQIKFWDESATRYDFIAFAGLNDSQRIESIDANTYAIDASNMYNLYYANRVSAKNIHTDAVPGVSPEFIAYKTPITFHFRRATARMRVGIYETIPGYAVKDVHFYYGDNETAEAGTSTKTTVALSGTYPVEGDYTITYDVDNNAHAEFAASGTTKAFHAIGALSYTRAESTAPGAEYLLADGSLDAVGDKLFLGTTSATATYALSTENIDGVMTPLCPWHPILPLESNTTGLKLRVDYTLVAIDGTGDVLHVKGAQAIVPVEYCQWRPNYSYTYLFKITNAAGTTGDSTSPVGLYPISFDAEASEILDGLTHEETLKDP